MTDPSILRRVCLVGAGYISSVHAEALGELGIPIAAVVDPSQAAREKLAKSFKIPQTYASVEAALVAGGFERAHLLVPPDYHATVALSLLRANKAVLIEKPLATSLVACDQLIAAAGSATPLGVNQNFVYHPAFARLRAAATNCELGQPRFVHVIYHAPLRQLATRQFGHWMFREPRNILLEQAVHPLSQLVTLCGDIQSLQAIGGEPIEIAPGAKLVPSFTASIVGSLAPASLRFAVGQNFPVWQVSVVCDDGVLFADMLANRFWTTARTRWMDAVNDFVSGQASALAVVRASWKNFLDYGLSTIKLRGRSDSFFQSMRASIGAFHEAVDLGKPVPLDGRFGRSMVELCDRIAAQILPTSGTSATAKSEVPSEGPCDVAVLGGTGFIGTAVVSQLRAAGFSVSVMARNLANLPAIFHDVGVTLHRGDIRSASDVVRAIAGAKCVINLAHGGGGGSWEEIRDAMVGGAETVAKVCLDNGNKPLLYVGSIAALYLGPQSAKITGATPPDPHAARRADYARAKALCEERLVQLQRERGLALCILRPGLVVGRGTSPFHSGLGFYNNEQHCIGWNAGTNPLPFVLVDDVAKAIVGACQSANALGKSYNLVGDFRPSARDYLSEFARVARRPLRFHSKSPYGLYLNELGKWCIKRLGGRNVAVPSLRDIVSRGLRARFDCSDAKSELGWKPVSDPTIFYNQAFDVEL